MYHVIVWASYIYSFTTTWTSWAWDFHFLYTAFYPSKVEISNVLKAWLPMSQKKFTLRRHRNFLRHGTFSFSLLTKQVRKTKMGWFMDLTPKVGIQLCSTLKDMVWGSLGMPKMCSQVANVGWSPPWPKTGSLGQKMSETPIMVQIIWEESEVVKLLH